VWGVEPAAWTGTDGGQGLLAATQEGRGVGPLVAAVGIGRRTLPLPPTPQDPNEGLDQNQNQNFRGLNRILNLI